MSVVLGLERPGRISEPQIKMREPVLKEQHGRCPEKWHPELACHSFTYSHMCTSPHTLACINMYTYMHTYIQNKKTPLYYSINMWGRQWGLQCPCSRIRLWTCFQYTQKDLASSECCQHLLTIPHLPLPGGLQDPTMTLDIQDFGNLGAFIS